MDPNANLKELLAIAKGTIAGTRSVDDQLRMAELIVALNDWLSKGGFMPAAWRHRQVSRNPME